jgi:UDP-glucose 4-epimerase
MQLAERYGVPTRIARVFLPFGPLDAPGKLLPSVRRALTQDQPVALSACEQSRDFLWAGDLSPAYAALARDLDRGGARIVNVCSGAPMRVRDMLEQLADRLGKPRHLLQFGARPLRPSEPLISVGDNQRLRDLGWTPTPIAQALGLWLAAADAVAQI